MVVIMLSVKLPLALQYQFMEIPLPQEFDFNQSLHFLKRSPKELLHQVEGDEVYKLISWNGEQILFKLRAKGQRLLVEFPISEPSAESKSQMKLYILEWLDLDKDLKPFYRMAEGDPFLSNLVKKYYGYRIVGQPDLYESLIWAVIGQQINLKFAYSLKQRFVEKFGKKLFFEGSEYYLFPDYHLVSNLCPDDLLNIQFSKQKARYAIGISQAFVAGNISKEMVSKLTLSEAKEKLMKIKGVGNWTANYALMKTFRYPDAFPLEDAGLHNALKQLMKLDRKPTLDEIRMVFENYKGWEAYATLYLWRGL